MQFLGIRVTVANGSNMVRAVWRLTIGTKTGTFTAGETITWAGGGAGVYLSDEGSGVTLYMTHTSGPEPAAGNTLTGGSSGATVPINALVPANFPDFAGNPPRFGDSPDQGSIAPGQFFFVSPGQVGVVGGAGSIGRSSFQLASNWGGTTYDHTNALQGVFAVIARSFTPRFGWVFPEAGDRLTADVVRQLAFQIETTFGALLTSYRAKHTKSSDQSITTTSETDVVALTGLAFPTAPDGTKLYRISYNAPLTKSTAAGLVTARLYVGTNGNLSDGAGSRVEGGTARDRATGTTDPMHLGVADLIVQPAAGQKFGLSIQTDANGVTVDGGTGETKRTSFIEVEEIFGSTSVLAPPAFVTFTKSSPWVNVGGEAVLAYVFNAFTGEVSIKGITNTGGSTVSSGADIVSAANGLPAGMRPSEKLLMSLGSEQFSIETDGSIKWRGFGTGIVPGAVWFNGCHFRAA